METASGSRTGYRQLVFGWRKDDEDPFAALKDGGAYHSAPVLPEIGIGSADGREPPAPEARPSINQSSTTPAPRRGSPLRLSRSGMRPSVGLPTVRPLRAMRLLIALFVIGAVVIPVLTAGISSHSGISVPSFSTTIPVSPAPSPGGGTRASYLDPSGLSAGLAHVARVAPRARLTLLRIDERSLTAIAVLPSGTTEEIYLGPSTNAVLPGSATGQRPIAISQVRPSAVGRITRDLARRFHIRRSEIQSLVLISPPRLATQWTVLTSARGNPGFTASLTGAGLRRLGT